VEVITVFSERAGTKPGFYEDERGEVENLPSTMITSLAGSCRIPRYLLMN